jgi:hypothetical protein
MVCPNLVHVGSESTVEQKQSPQMSVVLAEETAPLLKSKGKQGEREKRRMGVEESCRERDDGRTYTTAASCSLRYPHHFLV